MDYNASGVHLTENGSSGQKERNNKSESCQETDVAVALETRSSLPEKIIFCIDDFLLSKKFKSGRNNMVMSLHRQLQDYIAIKRKIETKNTYFFIMTLNPNSGLYPLADLDSFDDIISKVRQVEFSDEEPYDLGDLFRSLATTLELPDPLLQKPPHLYAYKVILLFGRIHVPVHRNCNSYYFLNDNPYFAFNAIHMKSHQQPHSANVSHALRCVVNGQKGYFFEVDATCKNDLRFYLNRMLGHSLLHSDKAIFSVQD